MSFSPPISAVVCRKSSAGAAPSPAAAAWIFSTAAGADHQAEVSIELGDVAGHAAVIDGVDFFAGQLERGRLARLPRLLAPHAQLRKQRVLPRASLVLHVHVRVERHERAVLELA